MSRKKAQGKQAGRGKSRFRLAFFYGTNRKNCKTGADLGKIRDFSGPI
jgi:hypothetical protein